MSQSDSSSSSLALTFITLDWTGSDRNVFICSCKQSEPNTSTSERLLRPPQLLVRLVWTSTVNSRSSFSRRARTRGCLASRHTLSLRPFEWASARLLGWNTDRVKLQSVYRTAGRMTHTRGQETRWRPPKEQLLLMFVPRTVWEMVAVCHRPASTDHISSRRKNPTGWIRREKRSDLRPAADSSSPSVGSELWFWLTDVWTRLQSQTPAGLYDAACHWDQDCVLLLLRVQPRHRTRTSVTASLSDLWLQTMNRDASEIVLIWITARRQQRKWTEQSNEPSPWVCVCVCVCVCVSVRICSKGLLCCIYVSVTLWASSCSQLSLWAQTLKVPSQYFVLTSNVFLQDKLSTLSLTRQHGDTNLCSHSSTMTRRFVSAEEI